jgi:hypothetical protein
VSLKRFAIFVFVFDIAVALYVGLDFPNRHTGWILSLLPVVLIFLCWLLTMILTIWAVVTVVKRSRQEFPAEREPLN